MKTINGFSASQALCFGLCACLSAFAPAWAESDKEMAEKAMQARVQKHEGAMDHSAHGEMADPTGGFHGVFYGYLPCGDEDCNGLKMTLSLNAKNRYLLVLQPAKPQNRESFEKGRYEWDDAKGTVLLIPNKEAPTRRLAIKEEGVLLYVRDDGAPLPGDQDRYLLQRTDKSNNREMHIH
jgi:hypothetical protein